MKTHNLIAIAVILSGLAPMSRADLILNGGFNLSTSETATPTDWTNIGPSDGVISDSVFGTPSYNGDTYYFDTGGFGDSGPTSGTGIEQTVATTIGTQYSLSFGFSNENAPGPPEYSGPEFLTVLVNGTPIQTYPTVYNSAYDEFQLPWVTENLNFTAASSSTTIAFTVTGINMGDLDPLVDGVDLEPSSSSTSTVPEPTSVLLFGSVLSLVGLTLRRKLAARD